MKIEIKDELVRELKLAEMKANTALGALARAKAEKRLGDAVDALVREMIAQVQALNVELPT